MGYDIVTKVLPYVEQWTELASGEEKPFVGLGADSTPGPAHLGIYGQIAL